MIVKYNTDAASDQLHVHTNTCTILIVKKFRTYNIAPS